MKKLILLVVAVMAAIAANAETVVTFVPGTDSGSLTLFGNDQMSRDGITISTVNGLLGNASQYRVRKDGSLTVTSTIGKICKVRFTNSAKSQGNINANVGTVGYDEYDDIWVGNEDEVTITPTNNSMLRLTQIEVTVNAETEFVFKPKFSVAGGTYYESQTLELTCATNGATIYYTDDGSTPSTGSTLYDAPIILNESKTLKAIAVHNGVLSEVASAEYVFEEPIHVANISEFNALADETVAVIDGKLIVYAIVKDDMYVKDNSGYLDIYIDSSQSGNFKDKYKVGDVIPVGLGCKKRTYRGNIEAYSPFFGYQDATETVDVEPLVVGATYVTNEHCFHYIKITDCTITAQEGISPNYTLTDALGNTCIVYRYGSATAIKDGARDYVTGIIKPYNGEPQLILIDAHNPVVEVENIAGFIDGTIGVWYTISNPVTVTGQYGNYLYIKDDSGYLLVYGNVKHSYNNGDVLTGIVGSKTTFSGLIEMVPESYSFGEATAGVAVQPDEITIEELSYDDMSRYIHLNNVTLTAVEGSTTLITLNDGTSDLIGLINYVDYPAALNGYFEIEGFVSVYNGTLELIITNIVGEIAQIEVDGLLYSLSSNKTATVVRNNSEGYESMTCAVIHPSVSYKGEDYIVKSIGSDAFSICANLNTILLSGEGDVRFGSIGANSSAIKTLCVEDGITSIGALSLAPNDIFCYSATPPTCSENTFTSYAGTLHVPASAVASYFVAPYWQNFANLVGDAMEPTGISLDKSSESLFVNGQTELLASISPANATPNTVVWRSTNEVVATVNNGVVNAVGIGECDIIVSILNKTAICHITVNYPEISLVLDEDEIELVEIGEQATLTATITPDNTGLTPTWTSSDESVATVDASGVVTAMGEGECDITATVLDKTATCHVTVSGTVTITLDMPTATIAPNSILTIYPTCTPDIEVDFTVSSSDTSVAIARIVNRNNAPAVGAPALASTKAIQIVGIKDGTATVTVGSADGKAEPATCDVTVATVTGIEDINVDNSGKHQRYNVLGQPVDDTYRGIVIENGKKMLVQ